MPPPVSQIQASRLHRGMEAGIGLFLCLILLLCIAGALTLIVAPHEKSETRIPAGIIILLVSLCGMSIAIRLIRGLYKNFFSPRALRWASWLFLLLAINGPFTDHFQEKPFATTLQTLAYLALFSQLRSLASRRESDSRAVDSIVFSEMR